MQISLRNSIASGFFESEGVCLNLHRQRNTVPPHPSPSPPPPSVSGGDCRLKHRGNLEGLGKTSFPKKKSLKTIWKRREKNKRSFRTHKRERETERERGWKNGAENFFFSRAQRSICFSRKVICNSVSSARGGEGLGERRGGCSTVYLKQFQKDCSPRKRRKLIPLRENEA